MIPVGRAEDVDVELFPDTFADPRESRAWAVANRWDGDGVGFLMHDDRTSVAGVRRVNDHQGWARMNVTDVCAGSGRVPGIDDELLQQARVESPNQLNVAMLGYGKSTWTRDDDPRSLNELVEAAIEQAAIEDRMPSFLHLWPEDPLLEHLRKRGWRDGVTDHYAVADKLGDDEEDWLSQFPSRRRSKLRADFTILSDAGGQVRFHVGDDTKAVQQRVAELESLSDKKHGMVADPSRLLRVNERLRRAFGEKFAIVTVHDAGGKSVASATVLLGDEAVLPRMVGLAPESQALAGYFHAAYYGPMALARSHGATRVLLGTGTATPKRLRGCRMVPLRSAVPPEATAHAALLELSSAALDATLSKEN